MTLTTNVQDAEEEATWKRRPATNVQDAEEEENVHANGDTTSALPVKVDTICQDHDCSQIIHILVRLPTNISNTYLFPFETLKNQTIKNNKLVFINFYF